MAKILIDSKPYEVKPGKNLLETCLSLGLDVPYFCWHPALGSVGACRQCAVKVFKDENDKRGRLIMSCMEPVADNQRISINDPDAREFRDHVIEWLMTNHPHDCAVCDEGGSCHLQDMTVMTGHAYRQFRFKKRTYENQYLGPFINHEMNRCIQCYRCVRYYKDYAGGDDLDAFASKNKVYFGRHEEGVLENEFSGNLAEVCPTGVFTDKTLKEHYTRKWDLTMAPSVCQHCSLGCNIIAGERYGSLRMISNRYNSQVNGYFICDRGRFGYEFVNGEKRIKSPFINKQPVTSKEILERVADSLKSGKTIGIGSARASLESNFVLRKLVGESNFFSGVSEKEHRLTKLIKDILTTGNTRTFSIKEVENSDAVLILGEDLTNTAPMLALAVRQSIRQVPLTKIKKAGIPEWNDAAAREYIQEDKGPLFIATVCSTKLDGIATQTRQGTPEDIARLGFAIAHALDGSSPPVSNLTDEERILSERIAKALMEAERPVIISGTSCGNESIVRATANVAWALTHRNPNAGVAFVLPECNSLGLSMLGGGPLSSAFEKIESNDADTVIVLENDLYRHGASSAVDRMLSKCKQLIVFDHTINFTSERANFLIPGGTFAEADGILINNEGRAQRFVQVFQPGNEAKESWRWLLEVATEMNVPEISSWKNYEDIVKALIRENKSLIGIEQVSLSSSYRVNGQKIPRQPHRYSGRTSMLANINVSEPKPPEDPDSPFSYTMEGLRGLPPSSMVPFFWSPGWNSVQSVAKYQEEVGGSLKGGDPGVRLIEPDSNASIKYFDTIPGRTEHADGKLLAVSIHHIFGSDELSTLSPGVAERSPEPYVMINKSDAESKSIEEGSVLSFEIDDQKFELPVMVRDTIPKGIAGLPFGLTKMPYVELPAVLNIKS